MKKKFKNFLKQMGDSPKRKGIFRLTFACMRCRDSDMGEAKRNRIHAVVRCKIFTVPSIIRLSLCAFLIANKTVEIIRSQNLYVL